VPLALQALAKDGYIFVFQNVRGRFKSEGVFAVSTLVDRSDPKAVNEATDAYDTIDWLVKNAPRNNGRVGIYGISYAGLTAALALLHPHPALAAVSEQAAPADQWVNDDFHRYGALRLSYAFEYAVAEQTAKEATSQFGFDTYDTYQWYLNLGPLSNVNERYLHGRLSLWNDIVRHPDYDAYWKRDAWIRQLHGTPVPLLNVAGVWDQEDPWGPWEIFRKAAGSSAADNYMVAGPWNHGGWGGNPVGDKIGPVPLGGHWTAREFREDIEAPFFRYYLHGAGAKPDWRVTTFQTGANRWRIHAKWPPAESVATSLYLHNDGTLSFQPPSRDAKGRAYREYVSDPGNPVPYRRRPISPIGPGGDWPTWEVSDQRFVDHRPDVLTYVSAPLERDLTVTGRLSAVLFASSSGTDSDFVIKLIDVFPENAQPDEWDPRQGPAPDQYARSLNGYELPIAMEVRRGRYLKSFSRPTPLEPDRAIRWDIPLRDHDHVFLRGHKIMVQIKSSWFPLIDRNPQRFVPDIFRAKASDFVKAVQRVFAAPGKASRIVLPVAP